MYCTATCCTALQRAALRCNVLHCAATSGTALQRAALRCNVWHCAANRVAGCPKWADLKAAGMPGVGCKQSCANGKFFAPELTIMDVLDAKFEEVNERITCCKFRFHGYVPGYCTKFNANGLSLDTYCANQIWNGVAPVSAVTLLQVWPAAHTQHATRNMQYAARNTQHSTCNAQRTQPNLEGRRAGRCRGAAASWLAGALAAGACVPLGMVGV